MTLDMTHRQPLLRPSFLVTLALGLLPACGGGGEAPAAETAALAGVPAEMPADLSNLDVPFKVKIDEPAEYEEAVEKPLAASFPAKAEPAARPAIEGLPAADPVLGEPLILDGAVVPFDQVRREICLGPLGQSEIADERTQIFVAEERQRRVQEGKSEGLTVPTIEIDDYLQTIEEGIKQEYPDGSVSMEDYYAELNTADPRAKIQNQMDFALLFLPDNPADFPPVTLEAILKTPAGQAILDQYKQAFDPATGKRNTEYGTDQIDTAILGQILTHLMEVASITADPAPGILYRVNGVDIPLDTIWNRIAPRVTPESVLSAKQWIARTTLLEKAFKEANAWLTDEEAYIAYHAHSDPYKDSMFSMERIAIMLKNFPSIERYKHHRRLTDCFKRLRNPSNEELAEYAKKRTNKVLGQVSLDVDIILCSAYDFRLNRWIPGGWEQAEERMKEVVRLLVEEQRPWEEVLEKHSEFYERPVGQSQQGLQEPAPKGRFRDMQRNTLIGHLGETDYGIFLTGNCVTDYVFFEQEVGTIAPQPLRGPFGWYLPRLLRRTKPPARIPMDEGTMRDLILDDYLTTEMNRFADELVQKIVVYGLQ
jgi:hypothetical protein